MQILPKRGILNATMQPSLHTRLGLGTVAVAVCATFLIGCSYVSDSGSTPETLPELLQAKLTDLHNTHQFPGATAAAILPDDSVITIATGYADVEAERTMKPDTPQYIGDTGMSFIAALALAYDRDGKVDLDQPVHEVLDMQGQHAWFAEVPYGKRITLRHLLTHTSGIRDSEDGRSMMTTAILTTSPERVIDHVTIPEEWIAGASELKSNFRPGTGFTMSRMGYRIAGLVLEHVGGVSLRAALADELLATEALSHTAIGGADQAIAKGYPGESLSVSDIQEGIWAGNAMTSTPDDLVRWTKQLYRENLLTEPYLEDLLASGYRGSRSDSQYGLGVYIYDTSAGEAYGHSGTFPGFATNVIYFPRHEIGVCIQVNRSYGNDTLEYVQELAQVVLNHLPKQS